MLLLRPAQPCSRVAETSWALANEKLRVELGDPIAIYSHILS